MSLMFLHFTKAATSICLLKRVFTTLPQKTLDFFQWIWLLIIINFIIEQTFAGHRLLKNTYTWLLLTSKFYSEFDSCSVTIKLKFACCRRNFPSCFSHGLWNNEFRWNYETITREIGLIIFRWIQLLSMRDWENFKEFSEYKENTCFEHLQVGCFLREMCNRPKYDLWALRKNDSSTQKNVPQNTNEYICDYFRYVSLPICLR